jgi:uncharacterized damage-inducible protein DinB
MQDWDPDMGLEDLPNELKALLVEDISELRDSFETVQSMWAATIQRARALPEARLHESVNGEWSFVRTLRHVIYAIDTWVGRMIRDDEHPFHPWGQPFSEYEDAAADLHLDLDAEPSLDEVLVVHTERVQGVRDLLAGYSNTDLEQVCTPDDTTHPTEPHTIRVCLWTVIEEGWWHDGFANRDLDALEAS